ncbi:hypothetical protein KY495_19475 [Massilia sp. PAMC28688]|uniref:type IV pilus modification PilV family protein n=1 Tax=Massilia sp. PAMC28688 TaxID=2861283 RepID=UPI001C636A84|nr:hypothetical protein [Massilia sp. PAMC28688]QYF92870.1 hypothetical protein KY495_19475 [Massilia sp. PAMC28688]
MMIKQQRGVALLESLIAIVLLAIGVIGTMGLQARTVVAMSEATLRAEAAIAGERLVAQLFNDQANIPEYATDGSSVPERLAPWLAETQKYIPGATVVVAETELAEAEAGAAAAHRQVDIAISWQRRGAPDASINTHRVSAHIASSQ